LHLIRLLIDRISRFTGKPEVALKHVQLWIIFVCDPSLLSEGFETFLFFKERVATAF
jgi:hypothetical protein